MIRYGLDFFEQCERSKMDYNVSQEVIDIINNLAQLVGAPSYVKTPNFKEKNHSRNKKHKTDWALIRNFKVTKIEKKIEGIEHDMNVLREFLNKMTDKTYEENLREIILKVKTFDKKNLIIIPSRMQSQRLPGKPLLDIEGIPMVIRVAQQAIKSNAGEVWIACCDDKVYKTAKNYGINVIKTKADHNSGSDRIYEAFKNLDKSNKIETIINLQGDMPTISSDIISNLVKLKESIPSDIFTLANDIKDLERRLGNILVGYTSEKKPVLAKDLNVIGSMLVLLKDAIKPNIIQSLENNPVFVHGGPFGNIAHGCNTIIATKTALKLSDYVVTEAGFGADLGAEKFLDIKCRKANLAPVS